MAVDETLVERVRLAMARHNGVSEQRMFGGLCFMVDGHMVCGTHENRFMFRVGRENEAAALARPGARPMDFTGRGPWVALFGSIPIAAGAPFSTIG